ncbi:hypothetical protein N9A86_03720 [Akkermansiaceae bacterium]|nr:hypothetical protein [Akkermansiaceae bacterium]
MTTKNPQDESPLSAMEKAAWTEFLVSLFTIVIVAITYPWLGDKATGGFGFMAFVTCGMWFLRGKRKETQVDERDHDIDRNSRLVSVSITWMFLVLTLIATVLWNGHLDNRTISLSTLNWLVWIQFALFFLVHGMISIISYRKQRHAS